jgi:hypothetical protein
MTSEYRPRDRHASRTETNSRNTRVLTIQPPHKKNQDILALIHDESCKYIQPADKSAFPANCNDIMAQKKQIVSIKAHFWH